MHIGFQRTICLNKTHFGGAERSQITADDGDEGGGELLLLRPPNARARDRTS
jgi:hypothetical protein